MQRSQKAWRMQAKARESMRSGARTRRQRSGRTAAVALDDVDAGPRTPAWVVGVGVLWGRSDALRASVRAVCPARGQDADSKERGLACWTKGAVDRRDPSSTACTHGSAARRSISPPASVAARHKVQGIDASHHPRAALHAPDRVPHSGEALDGHDDSRVPLIPSPLRPADPTTVRTRCTMARTRSHHPRAALHAPDRAPHCKEALHGHDDSDALSPSPRPSARPGPRLCTAPTAAPPGAPRQRPRAPPSRFHERHHPASTSATTSRVALPKEKKKDKGQDTPPHSPPNAPRPPAAP
ncbi:hypothetical protein FB451DRAFT_1559207 [Mycena latifolia]|nr:hypothetical protein FB451DRAFT_1559207 [Mycena latifolia]